MYVNTNIFTQISVKSSSNDQNLRQFDTNENIGRDRRGARNEESDIDSKSNGSSGSDEHVYTEVVYDEGHGETPSTPKHQKHRTMKKVALIILGVLIGGVTFVPTTILHSIKDKDNKGI